MSFWRGFQSNTPGLRCPHCSGEGHVATAATGNVPTPRDGSIALCRYCDGVAIYAEGATRLRAPSPMEMMQIQADPQFRMVSAAWIEAKRRAEAKRRSGE